jgi:putative PIN family toxin of toxin-antitoxin system
MIERLRVVLDTNALVSRLLLPNSAPARAVRLAVSEDRILASDATLMELADVLGRPKFDAYVTIEERQTFLRLFGRIAERVQIIHVVRTCRDPKDDKFLELAANGSAGAIVTGDNDLLALHPFRGIPVLTPTAFLASRPAASGDTR